MVELAPPPAATSATAARVRPPAKEALPRLLIAACILAVPVEAAAQKVRASNFSDVDFGTLGSLQSESRRSLNLCIYSSGSGNSYSVSASGSGAGSRFELSDGSFALPYEVEWSDSSGQSTGRSLAPNVALTGQTSSATNQFCSAGPAASASLTIVLRAAELSRARAGTYTGSLNILIAAE